MVGVVVAVGVGVAVAVGVVVAVVVGVAVAVAVAVGVGVVVGVVVGVTYRLLPARSGRVRLPARGPWGPESPEEEKMKKQEKKSLSPIRVGNNVLIRTVTHYQTGKIVEINEKPVPHVVLVNAAWIADTGRFNQALTASTVSEAEPFPSPVAVLLGAGVDITDWRGELPAAVK